MFELFVGCCCTDMGRFRDIFCLMLEFNLLDVRFILFLFPHDGSLGRFSRNVQGGTIQGSGIGYHLTTLVLEGFLFDL